MGGTEDSGLITTGFYQDVAQNHSLAIVFGGTGIFVMDAQRQDDRIGNNIEDKPENTGTDLRIGLRDLYQSCQFYYNHIDQHNFIENMYRINRHMHKATTSRQRD